MKRIFISALALILAALMLCSCAGNVITGDGTDTDTSDTTTASSTSDTSVDTSADTSDDPADTSDTTEAETTASEDTSGTTSEPETSSSPETTGKGGKTTTAAETTSAPEDEPLDGSEGLEYELKGKSYTVIGIGTCTDAELVVPSRYMGKPVTAIAPGAFRGCDFLTSVYTPDSVTSIGKEALADCPSIVSLDLGCLNGILHRLFRTLDSKAVSLGHYDEGVVKIENDKELEDMGFVKAEDDKYLIFPEDNRYYTIFAGGYSDEIEETFFRIPRSLTKVSIRNGSLPIEKFYRYTNILANRGTFSDFAGLKEIIVPDGIKELDTGTFSGCCSLKGNVKDGMKFIGSKSNPYLIFVGVEDTKITHCELPKGCRFISKSGAEENASLESRLYDHECMSSSFFLFDKDYSRIYFFVKDVVIGANLSGAFEGCSALEELIIPDTVKSICDNAFSGCSSLKTLRLPKGITFDPFTFKGVVCPLCKEYGGFLFMGTEEEPYKYFVKTNDRSSKNYEVPEGALAVYIDGDMEVDEIKIPKSLVEFSCLEHGYYGFIDTVKKFVYAGTSEEWFSINFTCADDAYYWEVYEDGDPDYDDIFYEHDDESEPIPVECSDKTIYVWFDGMLSATGRRP